MDELEIFWADLLSEEPPRILAVWTSLDADERQVIYEHLTSMATEAGWADVQQVAAQAALQAIGDPSNEG